MDELSGPRWDVLVGERLRRLRDDAGLRQDDMADRLIDVGFHGFEAATVGAVESGRRGLDPVELALYCAAMEVTLPRLLEGDGDEMVAAPGGPLSVQLVRRILTGDGPIDLSDLGAVQPDPTSRDARREAERKAAAKLRVDPVVLARTARGLWGRGLTAERDARVAAAPGEDRRTLQARRGHVTRELLAELSAAFEQQEET